MDTLQHFAFGERLVGRPTAGVSHVHIFDQPHFKVVVAAELDKIQQFIIIEATNDHSIDLDRIHADCLRGRKPFKHGLKFATLSDFSESVRVEGVQADIDAVESSGFQGRGLFCEKSAVRRQRQSCEGLRCCGVVGPGWETSPNQGFTSGQPDLRNALGDKEAGKTLDFVEGKDLRYAPPTGTRRRACSRYTGSYTGLSPRCGGHEEDA